MMSGLKRITVLLVLLVPAGVSCQEGRQQRYNTALANTGEPALHAVHSERLEDIMEDMNTQVFDRLPPELDPETERRRQLKRIAATAQRLSQDAMYIPDVLKEVRALDPEERALFNSLATKLSKQAQELEQQANDNQFDRIPGTMDSIIATCNACHTAFRVLPAVPKG